MMIYTQKRNYIAIKNINNNLRIYVRATGVLQCMPLGVSDGWSFEDLVDLTKKPLLQ